MDGSRRSLSYPVLDVVSVFRQIWPPRTYGRRILFSKVESDVTVLWNLSDLPLEYELIL